MKHYNKQGKKRRRTPTVFPHVTYFAALAIKKLFDSCLDDKAPEPSDKDWGMIEAVNEELGNELKASQERHRKWEERKNRIGQEVRHNKERKEKELTRDEEIKKLADEQAADMKETGHGS